MAALPVVEAPFGHFDFPSSLSQSDTYAPPPESVFLFDEINRRRTNGTSKLNLCNIELSMTQGYTGLESFDWRPSMRTLTADSNGASIHSKVSLITKLCEEEQLDEAIQSVILMEQWEKSVVADNVCLFLQECTKRKALTVGRRVHTLMVSSGLDTDTFLSDHLIRMFASCGCLVEAHRVFDLITKRSVYTWNAIISAHVKFGQCEHALTLFKKMQEEGIVPNVVTFSCVLSACRSMGAIMHGRLVHEQLISSGISPDVVLGNTLIDMYAKCGSLEEARKIFDELPNQSMASWGAMISGYADSGEGELALEMYERMLEVGVKPNEIIHACVLKACGSIKALAQGRAIHDQMVATGIESNLVVGITLVDMYAKCGSLEEARTVFENLSNQHLVVWGAMIEGYAQHEYGLCALELFERMQQEGIMPNKVIFLSALKACGTVGAITQGSLIHCQIIRSGLESDVAIGSTLVDAYAKCGRLEEAKRVFNGLQDRNVVSWGAMVAAYSRYGNCKLVENCLLDMHQLGLKPGRVIYISVLAACSHAGLLEEGSHYFKSMREDHGITPSIEHYNCMVDLLGRLGHLSEAEVLLQTMPIPPDIIGWTSLLTSCRTYGNVELGRQCFDKVIQYDPARAAGYVLMSNIYADAHMWEDADKINKMRKYARAAKKPGKAWIEVNGKVEEFTAGCKSHSKNAEIYAKLKSLCRQMKEEGYTPKLDLVLEPLTDEDKEDILCGHCEKLAMAFGLLSTPENMTLRISKNLRVCSDCHSASKVISKIEKREIIIRDAYRFHCFKDGMCSCGDFF